MIIEASEDTAVAARVAERFAATGIATHRVAMPDTQAAPHPASPPTLKRLRRDNAMMTTNYSCRIEPAVAAREAAIGKGGLLNGSELAQVFASLRANDLIWPYVVKGYLEGKAPPAFDLLYWNSDATNLPGPMFCWYLRNTYLENKLREPRGTVQCGEPVDLGAIKVPAFIYASKEDHIVPWKTAYASTQLLPGDTTFVLGASGHIAGVINPPAKKKRNYWTLARTGASDAAGGPARLDADPDNWLDAAESIPGSWWPAWISWLASHGGRRVAAPKEPGNAEFTPIEEAPGSYVKEKAP